MTWVEPMPPQCTLIWPNSVAVTVMFAIVVPAAVQLMFEIAGTSVSSPSNLGAGPDGEQQLAATRAARPHVHYADGREEVVTVLVERRSQVAGID